MKTNIKESRFFNNLFIENEKTEILVLGNSRIGDTILSTSLINHLLQNNPEADFTIVTSTISKDIFQDMPRLKSLIVIDKMKYKRHWYRIWEIVKDTKWELVVDLRSSILSYFLETKERKVFNHHSQEHKIKQYANFLKCNDDIKPIIWADQNKYINILKEKKISENYICVAPISNWQCKDWPIHKYYQLLKDPFFKNYEIVILGASDKDSDNTKINNLKQSLSIKVNNLINNANMIETYFILKKSKLFLGSDSSNMHLSSVAGIPTIGLFGPTNDKIYGPTGKNNLIIRTNTKYEELINDKNSTLNNPPSYLKEIKVSSVLASIKKIILDS